MSYNVVNMHHMWNNLVSIVLQDLTLDQLRLSK